MESMKIISSNLIFKNIEVSNNEDALKFLGQRLFDEQYVKESYIQAVVAREKKVCYRVTNRNIRSGNTTYRYSTCK